MVFASVARKPSADSDPYTVATAYLTEKLSRCDVKIDQWTSVPPPFYFLPRQENAVQKVGYRSGSADIATHGAMGELMLVRGNLLQRSVRRFLKPEASWTLRFRWHVALRQKPDGKWEAMRASIAGLSLQ